MSTDRRGQRWGQHVADNEQPRAAVAWPAVTPTREDQLLRIEHLERRRASIDQSMWQAPTLTIAAQAFLLTVLASPNLETCARVAVLLAGVVAVGGAVRSLLRQRWLEVHFSNEIARRMKELQIDDVNPPEAPGLRHIRCGCRRSACSPLPTSAPSA